MNTIRLIPRHELPDRWPRLRELLKPAMVFGQGEMEVDDILDLALQGRMFVFANEDFAVTAEFVHYPRKTVMVVGYGAGKVPAYRNVAKVLIDAAEHVGASAIRTYCRNPAMQRYYRRWFDGVEPTYTVLEKQL